MRFVEAKEGNARTRVEDKKAKSNEEKVLFLVFVGKIPRFFLLMDDFCSVFVHFLHKTYPVTKKNLFFDEKKQLTKKGTSVIIRRLDMR